MQPAAIRLRGEALLESADTQDELVASLAEHFRARGIGAEFANAMANGLTDEFATFEVPPPRPNTLSLLIGRYAIRKDNIKIFDALMDGLKAAAGVTFFTAHQPVLSANVGIGISLARVLRDLVNRGVLLNDKSLRILTILKCNVTAPNSPGLSPNEILEILQRTDPQADLDNVQQLLIFLRSVPTRDGGEAKLASNDASGRWRVHV
jgi:hypothetical protein